MKAFRLLDDHGTDSGTIVFEEFFKIMTHKILNQDTEDGILKAVRLLVDHKTGSGTVGSEEFFKIMTHIILNWDTEDEILKAFRLFLQKVSSGINCLNS